MAPRFRPIPAPGPIRPESKSGSSPPRGAARRQPSRPYVQAWYGHWIVPRLRGVRRHDRAAMAADVDEPSQFTVAVEGDHDRHRAGVRGEVAAGALQLAEMARVLPRAAEDPLHLHRMDRRIGVPGPRHRGRPALVGRQYVIKFRPGEIDVSTCGRGRGRRPRTLRASRSPTKRSASQVIVLRRPGARLPARPRERHLHVADHGGRQRLTFDDAVLRDVLLPHLGVGGEDTGSPSRANRTRPRLPRSRGRAGRAGRPRAASSSRSPAACRSRAPRTVAAGRRARSADGAEATARSAARSAMVSVARLRRRPGHRPVRVGDREPDPVSGRDRVCRRLQRHPYEHRLVRTASGRCGRGPRGGSG